MQACRVYRRQWMNTCLAHATPPHNHFTTLHTLHHGFAPLVLAFTAVVVIQEAADLKLRPPCLRNKCTQCSSSVASQPCVGQRFFLFSQGNVVSHSTRTRVCMLHAAKDLDGSYSGGTMSCQA